MASRPRSSLLDLFDPLLAEAVRVPIPDSPPSTPPRSTGYGPDKENVAPQELTMSVFFNRISHIAKPKARDDDMAVLGPLVDVADPEAAGLQEEKTPMSARRPLTEIHIEDFGLSAVPNPMNRSTPKKPLSPNRSRAAEMSPKCASQQTSYPFPVISVIDSAQHQNLTPNSTRRFHRDPPVLPLDLQCRREPTPSPPRGSLMPPPASSNNLSRMQHPRRSSLEMSMTLSSMSLGSFHLPDASFDLVNGEISFLSKSSLEDEDVNQEDILGNSASETPMSGLPAQKMIIDESPLGSLDSNGTSYLATSGKWEKSSTSPLLTTAPYNNNDQYLLLDGIPSEVRNPEAIPDSRASPVGSEGQETPLKTRRISSVPAPMKKLRVFTSGHRPAARTQVAVALLSDAKLEVERTSVASEGTGNSGIPPRGSRRLPISGNTAQHNTGSIILKRPLSANHTATNIQVPTACAARPPGTSMLRKPTNIPHIPRASNLGAGASKLPGPAASRDSLLPKPAPVSRLPAPSQRIPRANISARPASRVDMVGGGRVSRV